MTRFAVCALSLAVLAVAAGPLAAGESPEVVRTVFTVSGMHCDGCSAAITGTLQRIDGVVEVSADHEKGEAVAVYRPKKVTADELKAAIEKLGYSVTAMHTTAVDG